MDTIISLENAVGCYEHTKSKVPLLWDEHFLPDGLLGSQLLNISHLAKFRNEMNKQIKYPPILVKSPEGIKTVGLANPYFLKSRQSYQWDWGSSNAFLEFEMNSKYGKVSLSCLEGIIYKQQTWSKWHE